MDSLPAVLLLVFVAIVVVLFWLGSRRMRVGGGASRARSTLRRHPAYVWLLLLGLAANMFSGSSQYLGLPVSPDRALIPLALTLLLLEARRRRVRWGTVHWLMTAFVVWTVLSMAWFGNLADQTSVFALLDRTLLPFVLFCTAPVFFATSERRDLLLKFLTVLGAGLGVLAVLEIAAPQLVVPSYIVDPNLGLHVGRARGPFLAADAMGVAVLLCGFAAALLSRRATGPWHRLALAVAILSVVGVGLSLTRSVWVGAIVAIVVGTGLVSGLRRRLLATIAVGTGVVATAVLALPGLREATADRLGETGPIYDRLGSMQAALALLRDMPLTGIGWRRFYPYGADWTRQSDQFPMNVVTIEIHNVPLSRAAELGLPAAAVFVLILLLGPGRAIVERVADPEWAQWRVLAIAAFTLWFVTGLASPMAIPFPNYLTWLLAGVATWPWMLRPENALETAQGSKIDAVAASPR